MRGLVRTHDRVEIRELPVPEVTSHGVLVRVAHAGICRTDLHVAAGRLPVRPPVVLGHEFAGEVVWTGRAVFGLAHGDRVVGLPFVPCGRCEPCVRESGADPPVCDAPAWLGRDRDGAFAEFIAVPERALVLIPRGLDLRVAAFAEPVAAAIAVLRAPIEPHQRGLVHGSGRIATLTARILRAHGFEDITVSSSASGPFDFAIETTGTTDAYQAIFACVKRRGCVVVKSRPVRPIAFDPAQVVARELRLVGVAYGAFRHAIRLLATARLHVDDLFGASRPLDAFAAVFAEAEADESKKLFFALAGARAGDPRTRPAAEPRAATSAIEIEA